MLPEERFYSGDILSDGGSLLYVLRLLLDEKNSELLDAEALLSQKFD